MAEVRPKYAVRVLQCTRAPAMFVICATSCILPKSKRRLGKMGCQTNTITLHFHRLNACWPPDEQHCKHVGFRDISNFFCTSIVWKLDIVIGEIIVRVGTIQGTHVPSWDNHYQTFQPAVLLLRRRAHGARDYQVKHEPRRHASTECSFSHLRPRAPITQVQHASSFAFYRTQVSK